MRIKLLILTICFPIFCFSQKIALNDNFSSHASDVRNFIELNSSSEIQEYFFIQSILNNSDSIYLSCNAYLASNYLQDSIYFQKDRLHVFAAANTLNQVHNDLLNYNKNVLTVASAFNNQVINDSIHIKYDVAVDFYKSIATSYSTAISVGLIDKFVIDKSNSTAIKSQVVNSRKENYI